jgi:hypothetical protein
MSLGQFVRRYDELASQDMEALGSMKAKSFGYAELQSMEHRLAKYEGRMLFILDYTASLTTKRNAACVTVKPSGKFLAVSSVGTE